MKYIFVLTAAIFSISACTKTANIPPSHLDFISMSGGEQGFLRARFSADLELTSVFDRYAQAAQFSPALVCALSADEDFSVEHRLAISASGIATLEQGSQGGQRFAYGALLSLGKRHNEASSTNASVEEVQASLQRLDSIPCKVVVTAYGYKPYYTEAMRIPKGDFLRELSQ